MGRYHFTAFTYRCSGWSMAYLHILRLPHAIPFGRFLPLPLPTIPPPAWEVPLPTCVSPLPPAVYRDFTCTVLLPALIPAVEPARYRCSGAVPPLFTDLEACRLEPLQVFCHLPATCLPATVTCRWVPACRSACRLQNAPCRRYRLPVVYRWNKWVAVPPACLCLRACRYLPACRRSCLSHSIILMDTITVYHSFISMGVHFIDSSIHRGYHLPITMFYHHSFYLPIVLPG